MTVPYELVPGHRRIWKRTMGLIAGSYLLDTVLLAALAATGTIGAWVVGAYGGAGLATTLLFYALIASGLSERFADSSLSLPQLVVAVAIQLSFIVVAPPAAMYFVSVLFVVFGFAALRMRPRHLVASLLVVSSALVLLFHQVPQALSLPTQTAASRALVVFCIVTTLVRCALLGLYSSHLRALLTHRYAAARQAIDANEQRGATVATVLHDEIGQELTGISLILSACARRLREEGHAGAPEVETAAAHLREAIRKTRLLAHAARPQPLTPAAGPAPGAAPLRPVAHPAASPSAPRPAARPESSAR